MRVAPLPPSIWQKQLQETDVDNRHSLDNGGAAGTLTGNGGGWEDIMERGPLAENYNQDGRTRSNVGGSLEERHKMEQRQGRGRHGTQWREKGIQEKCGQ